MNLNTPQPTPLENEHPAIWPLVQADVERNSIGILVIADTWHQMGIAKYGTPLQPHNGRDPLVDAYQELLDGCVYAKQYCLENPTSYAGRTLYADTLKLATAYWIIIKHRAIDVREAP